MFANYYMIQAAIRELSGFGLKATEPKYISHKKEVVISWEGLIYGLTHDQHKSIVEKIAFAAKADKFTPSSIVWNYSRY